MEFYACLALLVAAFLAFAIVLFFLTDRAVYIFKHGDLSCKVFSLMVIGFNVSFAAVALPLILSIYTGIQP